MQIGTQPAGLCWHDRSPNVRYNMSRRSLQCLAKGKGNQKNEGMYFEYRTVKKTQPKASDTEDFRWVQLARRSVDGFRRGSNSGDGRGRNSPKRPQRQQQQQARQQQEEDSIASADSSADAVGTAAGQAASGLAVLAVPSAAAVVSLPDTVVEADAGDSIGSSSVAADVSQIAVPSMQSEHVKSFYTSGGSSTKATTMLRRKQWLLQRMKGTATRNDAAGDSGSPAAPANALIDITAAASQAAAATPTTAPTSALAEESSMAAVAAAAVAEAQDLAGNSASLLDPAGQRLLQELIDMADELTGPGGYNSVIDSDPLSDPLAGVFADGEDGIGENVSSSFSNGMSSSNGTRSSKAAEVDADGSELLFEDANATELFASVAEVHQQRRSAAQALAADNASTAAADDEGASGDSQHMELDAVAELLAWEAEQAAASAAGVHDIDIDEQLAATQRGNYGANGTALEGDWESGSSNGSDMYGDSVQQGAAADVDDGAWLQEEPELHQLLQANDAAFARMLAEVNDPASSSSRAGSAAAAIASSNSGAAGSRGEGENEQQDSWAGMGLQDWLEAAAEAQTTADGAESNNSEPGLVDLLAAIESDPSLNDEAKAQARLSIQGMFNDPGASAAAGSGGNSRRDSKGRTRLLSGRHKSDVVEQRTFSTTADVGAADEVPQLMPKPARPVSNH